MTLGQIVAEHIAIGTEYKVIATQPPSHFLYQ
jgi:hypothetical protein